MLHHDGRFTHEGQPIRHRKLREHFERSVAYLPDEGKFVVCLGHFRGEVQVEEAGFFIRELDLASGHVRLSDGTRESLDLESLSCSPHDGALLCRVKRDLHPKGLLARFTHTAQSELLLAVHLHDDRPVIDLAGRAQPFPDVDVTPSCPPLGDPAASGSPR